MIPCQIFVLYKVARNKHIIHKKWGDEVNDKLCPSCQTTAYDIQLDFVTGKDFEIIEKECYKCLELQSMTDMDKALK